ncbi:arginyl-tRNA--protein transferase 1 isoform X1 [Anopheles bellator]|uniref:arginyl-tRNA--protein transferase 1 isoform X1 n=1 Tax=Anopheles bellator TaxID=139047 RepID=UPI0026499584|nr:arginyl-tRNA--protein transferase 1 isoform X1 [Anopheles bellator]
MNPSSLVEYYGRHSNYRCGYCSQPVSCHSYGMWAHQLGCQDYQDLIDRGWRRSGCYCYKPIMRVTCCPSYTIKCDALNFQLSKSHKKIIKRVNKFLRDGIKEPHESEESADDEQLQEGRDCVMMKAPRAPSKQPQFADMTDATLEDLAVAKPSDAPTDQVDGTCMTKVLTGNTSKVSTQSKGFGSANSAKKAKLLRIERKEEKLQKKGISGVELKHMMNKAKGKNIVKTLEDFLDDAPRDDEPAAHRLKVKLVKSEEGATVPSYKVYTAYQQRIHKDSPSKLSIDRYKRFLVKTPLKIVTVSTSGAQFKEAQIASYVLFEKYQTVIHNDRPGSIADYLEFLVESPLKASGELGSFHQQYWLDDRLIAVGVIDVLPYCVSSVYFFYDPEFQFLSLGTYGSLKEIAFSRALHKQVPTLKNYYMGFYIQSCPKMRYKGNLQPSYLLCPEVFSWHLLDTSVKDKLDVSKYCRLNEDPEAEDDNLPNERDLGDILVAREAPCMTYSEFQESFEELPELREYARLVGKECASRMLLCGV